MGTRRLIRRIGGLALAGTVVVVALGSLARCRSIRVAPAEQLARYDAGPYAEALRLSVRDGRVDYAALRSEGAPALDRYLDAVARFGPTSTPDAFATDADRLAFHLNAYNAIMLRRWLDAGAGAGGGAEDAGRTVNRLWFVFDQWKVDGSWVTLDTLEQRIIRPRYREPRVHFALVCGAAGCPPLLEVPFDGDRLDAQLDAVGRRWLAGSGALAVGAGGAVRVSQIFAWYAADFEPWGGLEGVFARYLPPDDPRRSGAIAAARAGQIRYAPYDWSINRSGPSTGSP